MSRVTYTFTAFLNMVAILVHLWAGCCAHQDHSCADHNHQSFSDVRHSHTHSHSEETDSPEADHEEPPFEVCDHGSCDFSISHAVKTPAPELSALLNLTEIQLVMHSPLETSLFNLRPACFSCAPGARLHQPLEVWLI
ncbi:MAG: hypothetical protein KDA65_09285 [Planctomycetaceae bacterium]|nr:hypothetical protein [Planctomycetaceae bacterium]